MDGICQRCQFDRFLSEKGESMILGNEASVGKSRTQEYGRVVPKKTGRAVSWSGKLGTGLRVSCLVKSEW